MFYPPRRSKDGCTIVSDNEEFCLTQTGAQVVLRVPTRNELFVFNFEEVFFLCFSWRVINCFYSKSHLL